MYFRNYYSNLYYWGNQTLGNEIYLKTINKYGDGFWGYKTYILTNATSLPLFSGNDITSDTNTFFSQFSGKNHKPNITLTQKYPEKITEKTLIIKIMKRLNIILIMGLIIMF